MPEKPNLPEKYEACPKSRSEKSGDNIRPIWTKIKGSSEGYSPVRHMASALFPSSDKKKYMLMLSAYMDETGHSRDEKQRFNGMAGLIAPAAYWEGFEERWNAILTSKEFNIDFFHMKDFANFAGFFKGWSEPKRQKLYGKLLRCIEKVTPFPIGSILPMRDYRSLTPEEQRYFEDPYYIGFLSLTAFCSTIAEYLRAGYQEKVALVFSDQAEFRNKALRMYEASLTISKEIKRRTTPPDFRDMKDLVPLQAADIVAYELYKEYERRLHRPDAEPRYGYKIITKMSQWHGYEEPMFKFHTKETLLEYVATVKHGLRKIAYWEKKKRTKG